MNKSRPSLPRQLKRDVLLETGHRCAIPACQHPTTEIAHIIPWEQVQKHEFHNLIALCPNCHTRFDSGEIDRKSVQQYKANLSILNSRYGDLEKRVLRYFAKTKRDEIVLSKGLDILLSYIIEDGLLQRVDSIRSIMSRDINEYKITPVGKKFIAKWLKGKTI